MKNKKIGFIVIEVLMSNLAVTGTHWGDEGKGRVVYLLSGRQFSDNSGQKVAGIKCIGAHNAGNGATVGGKKVKVHLLPITVARPNTISIDTEGVLVDQEALLDKEIPYLESIGVNLHGRTYFSSEARLILTHHKEIEGRGIGKKLGTTLRGVGPAAADREVRMGVRFYDLQNGHAADILKIVTRVYGLKHEYPQRELEKQLRLYERMKEKVTFRNTEKLMRELLDTGARLVFHVSHGGMLDLKRGSHPYVTSANAMIDSIPANTGINLRDLDLRVVSTIKAYTTRVGEGPLPSEISGEVAEDLRRCGDEYGVSTGRPRRIGWHDTVAGKYVIQKNRPDALAVIALDVFDNQDEILVCVGYNYKGSPMKDFEFPDSPTDLVHCTARYRNFRGWKTPTNDIRYYGKLPEQARTYLDFLSDTYETPIALVTVGPAEDAVIYTDASRILRKEDTCGIGIYDDA